MTKRIAKQSALGLAVLILAFCCVGLLTIPGSSAAPLSQGSSSVPAYDPAVGFRPWDAAGRETPTESWPEWLTGWSSDSQILTNPPLWYVSPESPAGSDASLYFLLNRQALTNDLGIELTMMDSAASAGASLYLDLLTTNRGALVTGLYGNLLAGGNEVAHLQIGISLATNPAAAVIRVRRGAGAIVVYDVLLRECTVGATSNGVSDSGARTKAPGGDSPVTTMLPVGGTEGGGLSGDSATGGVDLASAPVGVATNSGGGGSRRAPSATSRRVVYVDRMRGDDTLSGVAETVGAGHGPKRTIRAGMAVGRPGDMVVIKDGGYRESLNVAGRDISVRIVGHVDLTGPGSFGGGRSPVVGTNNVVRLPPPTTNTIARTY